MKTIANWFLAAAVVAAITGCETLIAAMFACFPAMLRQQPNLWPVTVGLGMVAAGFVLFLHAIAIHSWLDYRRGH